MALTRRKKILFALTAITIAAVGSVLLLLIADLVLHQRAERSAGLNRYGYRGPVVGKKQPGELRVAMVGGSTVFGYGVRWEESIPAYLETELKHRLNGPVRVLNLGFNNEGVYAAVPNLEDFSYLDYDVIVLYQGYNDLSGDQGVNRSIYRRDSAVYRLTGYYPILPLYLQEKAMTLRSKNVNAAYEQLGREGQAGAVVFRPGLAQRTSAATLDAIAAMTRALDGQFEKSGYADPPTAESASTVGCKFPFVTYCESLAAAVRFGLLRGKGVVVAAQPQIGGRTQQMHKLQHDSTAAMMSREFDGDRRVVWADLSTLLDLASADVTFDGMHLKPDANRAVAQAMVERVIAVMPTINAR